MARQRFRYGSCPHGLELQSVLFPKSEFEVLEAYVWLSKYGLKPVMDESRNYWRSRQRPPTDFMPGSFRTIQLGRGSSSVKAVVGCPWKKQKASRSIVRRRRS